MPPTLRTKTLFLTALMVTLMGLLVDFHLTRKYGGGDLRDKTVGSRSLLEGRSPYFEPWRPGDPERFADPMVPIGSPLTRFTGSPFQALIMAPMGMVPFPAMRLSWLFLQYGMLLLTISLMIRGFGQGYKMAGLIAVAFLVVIVGSTSWRLHVERGQVYVIYALVISAIFLAAQARRDMLVGVLGAMLILFKPTFGLLLLPLIFKVTPKMIIGGGAMLVVALIPFLFLPDGFNSWSEYSKAMETWGAYPGYGAIPPAEPAHWEYPETIEGVRNLADHHAMETENGSVSAILAKYGILVPNFIPFGITLALILAVAAAGWKKRKIADAADLILLGFCFNTILMMLLPTLRFHYQFVMWTAPVLYMLLSFRHAPLWWYILAGLAGFFVVGALDILPVNVLLAECALLAMAAYFIHQKYSDTEEPVHAQRPTISTGSLVDKV